MELILKKRLEKSPGSATITRDSPSQTTRGRENRQNQNKRILKRCTKSCNASVFMKKISFSEAVMVKKIIVGICGALKQIVPDITIKIT